MTQELRILLLGGAGFVGQHLQAALTAHFGETAQIKVTSRFATTPDVVPFDIRDTEGFSALLRQFQPTHVVNLAGIAAPVEARRNPELAWEIHAMAPERLGRVILSQSPQTWLLHIGSGMIYGKSALSGAALNELALVEPMDIYGVTKAAGDLAIGALAGEGLKCLRLRPFNHTGPGQSEDFAIPAFAAQIARIKAGKQSPKIRVGNLSALRDFLDVRDVANAYVRLIDTSGSLIPGAIYNIASGEGVSIHSMLHKLIGFSEMPLAPTSDPDRQRPNDLPTIVGCSDALTNDTGWARKISLDETLKDVLASCVASTE